VAARVSAVVLGVAGVGLYAASVLLPSGVDDEPKSIAKAVHQLEVAADHRTRVQVAFILIVFGLIALIPGWIGLLTLVPDRGATLGVVGTVLASLGAAAGAYVNAALFLPVAYANTASLDRDAMAAYLHHLEATSGLGWFFLLFLGLPVGSLLTAIALWRAAAVPRWQAVLLPIGVTLAVFSSGGLVWSLAILPFPIALLALSVEVYRRAEDPAASPAS
jgi:hypothetical protein